MFSVLVKMMQINDSLHSEVKAKNKLLKSKITKCTLKVWLIKVATFDRYNAWTFFLQWKSNILLKVLPSSVADVAINVWNCLVLSKPALWGLILETPCLWFRCLWLCSNTDPDRPPCLTVSVTLINEASLQSSTIDSLTSATVELSRESQHKLVTFRGLSSGLVVALALADLFLAEWRKLASLTPWLSLHFLWERPTWRDVMVWLSSTVQIQGLEPQCVYDLCADRGGRK